MEVTGFKEGTETFKCCEVQKKLSGIKLLCHTEVIVVSNRAVKKCSHTLADTKKNVDRSKGREAGRHTESQTISPNT